MAISAHAQLFPARPDVTYVADTAHVLTAQDSATITKESKALLKATGAPIVVATVKSLASENAQNLGVEKYAQKMFDTWHIGSKNNNRGILIVLAKDDHKARIEFGKSWAHKYDGRANGIMQSIMIPHFRSGNYSQGLTKGVIALANLAKGIKAALPTRVTQAPTPVYIDQTSHGSLPVTYSGEPSSSPFDFPAGSQGFNPTWVLGPIAFMLFPFLIVIALIASSAKRGTLRSGARSNWNDPNRTFNDPFSNSHHHHHDFGSSNSSSTSDSTSSSSSSSSDSGGSSGGGGSTGSW